ncbi:hypothetical protein OLMES_2448 [Oleiphilus messinensis]|uniref:Uncharacterized protein n=1 Tax=Oleiphilus messinensis TaxID=141451 RepID=A0A1Y0I8I2_9GAMM|nr:hypothetical protein [Oleiphilus messinensis]ARU56509.1 hypothetical protein OLMES_2448 [Oleiphilus messinensis]
MVDHETEYKYTSLSVNDGLQIQADFAVDHRANDGIASRPGDKPIFAVPGGVLEDTWVVNEDKSSYLAHVIRNGRLAYDIYLFYYLSTPYLMQRDRTTDDIVFITNEHSPTIRQAKAALQLALTTLDAHIKSG